MYYGCIFKATFLDIEWKKLVSIANFINIHTFHSINSSFSKQICVNVLFGEVITYIFLIITKIPFSTKKTFPNEWLTSSKYFPFITDITRVNTRRRRKFNVLITRTFDSEIVYVVKTERNVKAFLINRVA